ncbi:MAG: FxLYD domain-containing protein [Clostridia bacterium]
MSEMKKCKHCQTEIDKKAKICPTCKKKQGHTGLIISGIIIAIIIVAIATSGGNKPNNQSGTQTNTETKNQEKFTLQEGHKGYTDEYGMSYYIEGTIKNNTHKQYSYVQITLNLYDVEGAQVGSAVANINNLEPNGLWKFKALGSLGDGKKVASYKMMEITGF